MGDTDPIPLATLQHRCMLIHAEQAFAENVHTLRGQAVHARVDAPGVETRAGVRAARAVPLWCDRLGLIGKADVVEFAGDGTPYPVEYKHGRKGKTGKAAKAVHDDLQLAAQALCLEEMTGKEVNVGAIYHATSHRRREVAISACRSKKPSALSGWRWPPANCQHRSTTSAAGNAR